MSLPKAEGEGAHLDLVVFPSNRQLALRAHGMAPATLRRHLAALVEAGLIIRRDSPNGKRYARKADAEARGEGERFADVFGFDLAPLAARAPEFEAMAEELRRERRAAQLLKERISLHRRDCGKLIALGLDEGLAGPWDELRQRFLGLSAPCGRCVRTRPWSGSRGNWPSSGNISPASWKRSIFRKIQAPMSPSLSVTNLFQKPTRQMFLNLPPRRKEARSPLIPHPPRLPEQRRNARAIRSAWCWRRAPT